MRVCAPAHSPLVTDNTYGEQTRRTLSLSLSLSLSLYGKLCPGVRGVRSSVSDVAVLECAGSGQARPGHPPSLSTPAAPVREGGPGGRGREEGGGGRAG